MLSHKLHGVSGCEGPQVAHGCSHFFSHVFFIVVETVRDDVVERWHRDVVVPGAVPPGRVDAVVLLALGFPPGEGDPAACVIVAEVGRDL